MFLLLSLFLLFATHIDARNNDDATISFTGTLVISPGNPPEYRPYSNIPVTLNAGEYNALSNSTGGFTFHNVKPGVYNMEVLDTLHHFPQIRMKYNATAADPVTCNLYPYAGAPQREEFKCSPTFQLPALAAYAYFEKRPPFSIMGLFRNPMLLMMLFSGGMMYMMPKMMEGMDDEQKEAMQKQMAMQSDPQAMLAELFGGGGDDEPVGGSKKSIGGGGGGGGGGGAKKRR
ncbi:hypothetical protein TrCOL_g13637 [Triparma columacea]|uniref:ER membrane protein complex subunit 7 beta-sandwich domain-containing protein n=1 Tax=Triparma columacea TaxID=722753 RepID=A0A9W7G1Y8_9STRA|nr:hypothetical protein TrCOL_g13637 [Triparma columacea]